MQHGLKLQKIPGLTVSTNIRFVLFGIIAVLPALLLLAVALQPWVSPHWLFLDVQTAAEMSDDCCHVYYGAVSTLGIMLWGASAAICLAAALVFIKTKRHVEIIGFAIMAGVFTGWLALDDAFLLHEIVLPKLGIPQNIVLGIYVVLAIVYVVKSWRVILSSEYWLLVFAGMLMASSLLIDTVLHSVSPSIIVIEDSAKFLGICAWAGFHITAIVCALTDSESTG